MEKKGFVPEAEILYTDPLKKEHEKITLKINKTLKNQNQKRRDESNVK